MANEKNEGAHVVVVGAGAAGIKLAHTLWKESLPSKRIQKITILEANDYVGGRVRHFEFEGHTVERGANWISGRELIENFDNPIWQLAKAIELQGQASDRENPERIHVVDCTTSSNTDNTDNGAVVVTKEYLELVQRFDAIYEQALHKSGASLSYTSDTDVRTVLESHGWTPKDKLNNLERAVEHNVLEVWAHDSIENLSAAHELRPGMNDVELGQDELFVEDPRGFNSIFTGMVQDLQQQSSSSQVDLLLEHPVQSIHYAPGMVKVVAKDLTTGETKEYHADRIVSTVSVGVLQQQQIHFDPPFPDWKVTALNRIEMFCFAKVYAKFRKRLWPADKDYLVFISDGEDNRGYYPLWMRYKTAKEDEHLYMCYQGGDNARRVESLSQEQIKDEVQALFSKAFGGAEDCRPVAVAVTDWSRNPRFCGSYSAFPKNAFATVPIEDLRRGLTGCDTNDNNANDKPTTLYFAGEAFDNKYNGWVQGGYLSGERVARTILKDLDSKFK
ncbi:specific histone demethylase 1B [Seminavis robusta]|uniref:Specific histone demethylase 1B n=1 Tax=Seminavis robusta TaxID=568900 RepID=A0A9N8H7R6_9STRA|nr:specific histone demethylase 1B [Seminavis robusta]|eukprot:Sro213_g088370.1 specific histone demethylase 1B (502) ;mRNA; r:24454-25959